MAGKLDITSTFTLQSGRKLPILGFGVWDSPQDKTVASCLSALFTGYRHIDTAQVYGNEAEVGLAVSRSHLPRDEIFITSKILKPTVDAESTYQKALSSVKKIAGEAEDAYVDLMLIHNVTSGREGIKMMWRALERLYDEGRARSIGVSNAGVGIVEGMREYARVWPPHVNQLELHPWTQQRTITSYCQSNNIILEAYCPLVRNQKATDPTLVSIAEKHGKSTAQVLLRYCLQKGWSPLPKSDNPERIKQNADIFDFELSAEDMEKLDAKDEGSKGALVVAVDNETTG